MKKFLILMFLIPTLITGQKCDSGDCNNGQGTFTYPDGRSYVGEYKDGKRNGQGTFTYLDGRSYVGEYKDGKRNGQGTFTYRDGRSYVGEYKDGERNGLGIYTYADGSKYVGEWKDDIRNGKGAYTRANGGRYVGEWKDDKKNGLGTYYRADGSTYVGEWKDDLQTIIDLPGFELVEVADFIDSILGKFEVEHKNEATSSSGYITKDPPKPANIKIVDGSVKFVDQNQNNAIDANEVCSIEFTIQNTGTGEGMAMKLVTNKVYGNDVKFNNNIPIGNLSPGASKSVKLSIQSGMNTSDGNAHFKFVVNELNGFGSNPYEIDIPVKSFIAPELVVVDHKVSSKAGKIVKKEAFDVELVVQNIGQGTAKNIKVNLIIPQNIFVMDGEINITIPDMEAGASKVIACQLIANNNYSSSEITIKADLSESYGKYAKDKNIVMQMDQVVSSNKLSLTAKEQQNKEIELVSLFSAVDKNIPVSAVKYDNRIALIIGNEDYSQSLNSEIDVDYAVNDATVFKKYANRLLGVKEENTFFITNASSGTMQKQIDLVSKLAKRMGSTSEIVFYYAGHGVPDEKTKEPYIIPVDVDATNLSAAIKLKDLYNKLAGSEAKRVTVFLDACFSGGARNMPLLAARGVKIKPKEEAIIGNIVVFSATSEEQSALSFDKEKHGMFTYFLLKKLQESSGKATYAELKEYINYEVGVESLRINHKEQNPQVNISPVVKEVWKNWNF